MRSAVVLLTSFCCLSSWAGAFHFGQITSAAVRSFAEMNGACSPVWNNLDNLERMPDQQQAIKEVLEKVVNRFEAQLGANKLSDKQAIERCEDLEDTITSFVKIVDDVDFSGGIDKVDPKILDRQREHSEAHGSLLRATQKIRQGDRLVGDKECVGTLRTRLTSLDSAFRYLRDRIVQFQRYPNYEERINRLWNEAFKKRKNEIRDRFFVRNSEKWNAQYDESFLKQCPKARWGLDCYFPAKEEENLAFEHNERAQKLQQQADVRSKEELEAANKAMKSKMDFITQRKEGWLKGEKAANEFLKMGEYGSAPETWYKKLSNYSADLTAALLNIEHPEAETAAKLIQFDRESVTTTRDGRMVNLKAWHYGLKGNKYWKVFSPEKVKEELQKLEQEKRIATQHWRDALNRVQKANWNSTERDEFSKYLETQAPKIADSQKARSKPHPESFDYWKLVNDRRTLALTFSPWDVDSSTGQCALLQLFHSMTPLGEFRAGLKPHHLDPQGR